eukprot:c11414_g1_i1 orf=363-2015(-)
MGCFAVQKAKRKVAEQPTKLDETGDEPEASSSSSSSPTSPRKPTLSAPPSFRRTVRTIQNAQRFIIHSNPKLSSSHPSYGSRENRSDQGAFLCEGGTLSKPMPLPSPRLSPKPTGYVLPHPSEHVNVVATSPNLHGKNASAGSVGHGALNSRVFPSDLQPLPPPKDVFVLSTGLRSFTFEELATACQHFSQHARIGDDGFCFAGSIKTGGGKGAKQQQDVVIHHLHEKFHLGLKEWMSELSNTRPHNSHLCKLVGFYGEDGKAERFLVYTKPQKGSLHNMIFEASADTPPLDWTTRMKIMHCAVDGLASLHERFPEQILYKDFRLSHIHVDIDNNAKLSGYWFVTSNNQILQSQLLNNSSSARANAYCAPETKRGGVMTLKSNVWSLGVVMLEIMCGRKNLDERLAKDEKYNLVKWAKPFLLEENKLFLIMDPKLQGRFSSKGAKIIANLTLQCLQKDPTRRPCMKVALDMVKAAQETRHTSVVARKERSSNEVTMPASAPLPSLALSQSLKPGLINRTMLPSNRSPTKFDLIQSPVLKPLVIPSRSCAN